MSRRIKHFYEAKPLMSFYELCCYLGKSENVVRRLVFNEGKLWKKDNYYSKVLVDQWLATPALTEEELDVNKMADDIIANLLGKEAMS